MVPLVLRYSLDCNCFIRLRTRAKINDTERAIADDLVYVVAKGDLLCGARSVCLENL